MNYLFIGVDQLRFDTIYGEECKTPNIDNLKDKGIDFTSAYTTAPLCTPARASMFTGLYSFQHQMINNCDMYHFTQSELQDPSLLLHKRLIEKGIKCSFVGKWHVGTNIGPTDVGFEGMNVPGYGSPRQLDSFKTYLENNDYTYDIKDPIYYNPNQKTLSAGIWDGPIESTVDYYLVEETINEIEKHQKNKDQFFVTCQFWGPHGPHFPPKEFVGINDRSAIQLWGNMDDSLEGKPHFVKRHLRDFYRNPPKNDEEWIEVIGLYYDYMTFIDSQIGRLCEYLKKHDLLDSTMIIFTADHGDMKGAHNGLIDKGFLYQEAIKIPFIIHHPEYSSTTSNEFVYNMDVLPTILSKEGIDITNLDGIDVLNLLDDPAHQRTSAYIEFHGLRFLYTQRAVINKDNLKYIWSPGDFDEVYDLNKDPYEMKNVIDCEDYQIAIKQLQEELKQNAVQYQDPVMDYVYKILGDWQNPSGKFDTSNQSLKKVGKL